MAPDPIAESALSVVSFMKNSGTYVEMLEDHPEPMQSSASGHVAAPDNANAAEADISDMPDLV